MIDNKLTKLLSTLSRKELTRFREFVHSPYFQQAYRGQDPGSLF